MDQVRARWLGWAWRAAVAAGLFIGPVVGLAQDDARVPGWEEQTIIRVPSGPWTGPRLPDGQPDVSGFWSNTQGNHGSLTGRPIDDPPAAGRGGQAAAGGGGGGRGRRNRVTDPPDGQVPYQPWARAKVDELRAHLNNPTSPEHVEPFARCWPGGPTKSFMWHGYEIRQYPGYFVFHYGTSNRIIHLDDKPHVPAAIKLWNGDARGRWEGNTLVVDTTNNNSKWRFARTGEFVSEHATIAERFTFASDGSRFIYDATYTDPTVLTRPFTVSIPNKRVTVDTPGDEWNNETVAAEHDGPGKIIELWELSCHEGNAAHETAQRQAAGTK